MKKPRQQQREQTIVRLYREVEEEFKDKSTEFILSITAERVGIETGVECDHGDVVDALINQSVYK